MLINIRVIPRSSKNTIEWANGLLKVRLTAPPVDGAANEALVVLLAEALEIPRRQISIVRGVTSKLKTIEVAGMTEAILLQKLRQTR